jgi:hypothetical protein
VQCWVRTERAEPYRGARGVPPSASGRQGEVSAGVGRRNARIDRKLDTAATTTVVPLQRDAHARQRTAPAHPTGSNPMLKGLAVSTLGRPAEPRGFSPASLRSYVLRADQSNLEASSVSELALTVA